jgi:hypothetical protein
VTCGSVFVGDGLPDIVSNTYDYAENSASTALLFVNHGGTFVEDDGFAELGIRGHGETIVVADFDNDGSLDIFLPYYSFQYGKYYPECGFGLPPGHTNSLKSYLLINDGAGHFTDVADAAGVALRDTPPCQDPEAAQAADFNDDGFIDLYVGGHLFLNLGNHTFRDASAALKLASPTGLFDEGAKFSDWNSDGKLDLIVNSPTLGPQLFQFDGTTFSEVSYTPTGAPLFSSGFPFYANVPFLNSYGMNVADVNNDGREDVFTAGGTLCDNVVFLNTGIGFERAAFPNQNLSGLCNGQSAMAFGDMDRDGDLDVIYTYLTGDGTGHIRFADNHSPFMNDSLTIDLLGPNGEKNQQGRVVRISPVAAGGRVTYTRVVDGGSGYLSQNEYSIHVGTPYPGVHTGTVLLPYLGSLITITFEVRPGQHAQVFAPSAAAPAGRVVVL